MLYTEEKRTDRMKAGKEHNVKVGGSPQKKKIDKLGTALLSHIRAFLIFMHTLAKSSRRSTSFMSMPE